MTALHTDLYCCHQWVAAPTPSSEEHHVRGSGLVEGVQGCGLREVTYALGASHKDREESACTGERRWHHI